jgi:nitroimidazol reductase NimA-like FMN-containing flavoprotein (pyridoxamine 5'-phosphate oxidase superfamily)
MSNLRHSQQVPRDRTDPGKGFVEVDRNGLEILDRHECLHLLGAATLGRVGVTFGALPVVLPVNFRLVDEQVVLRTGIGTKLDAATCETVVAFEVDDFDGLDHSGWSVLVTGFAREVTDPDELAVVQSANVPRWAPSKGERYIAISTDMISGRRIDPLLG